MDQLKLTLVQTGLQWENKEANLQMLEEKYGSETVQSKQLNNLSDRLKIDLEFLQQHIAGEVNSNNNALTNYYDIYLELLDGQRKMLTNMNRKSEFDEDLIRKYRNS